MGANSAPVLAREEDIPAMQSFKQKWFKMDGEHQLQGKTRKSKEPGNRAGELKVTEERNREKRLRWARKRGRKG